MSTNNTPKPTNKTSRIVFSRGHSIAALLEELSYFRKSRNAAAGADAHALQGSDGVGEADNVIHAPILEQAVDECAVKDVARAGGIGDGNLESVGLHDTSVIHKHSAFRTSRDTYDRAAVAIGERARIIGEIRAGDKVIDQAQKFVGGVVIHFIDVDDDRNLCFARPARGLKRSDGIAAIEVQQAGADDALPAQLSDARRSTSIA